MDEKKEENGTGELVYSERRSVAINRQLLLPDDVDVEADITASAVDGILTVVVNKKAAAAPRVRSIPVADGATAGGATADAVQQHKAD